MAVAITQTANPAGVDSASSVATYSSASIGTASSDRIVVLVVGVESTTGVSPSSATIDYGGGATAMTALTLQSFSAVHSRIFHLAAPTGTTATFTISYPPTNNVLGTQNHIAVYSVTGADTTIASEGGDTSTDMDATSPLTTGSITIPADGGFIAVAAGRTDSNAKTWANASVDIEADAGFFRFTTATSITAGTVTVTCTGTSNGEDGALSYVIFNPDPSILLSAGGGSYAITGTAASIERGLKIVADAGSYAITGQTVTLNKGIPLVASAGSYAVTGTNATLLHNLVLVASAGSYALTGANASLLQLRQVIADSGIYLVSGTDADLTIAQDATASATASSAAALTGHWRGPAGGKRRRHTPGQPRLLSELDPPLFTPEEILEAPGSYNVDDATRAEIEKIALEAFADVMDTAARRNLQRMHYDALLAKERAMIDDEETFLLM